MKTAFLLLGLVLSLNKPLSAQDITKSQENPKESNVKHALGAGAGFTTGYGLSYRYMNGRFGLQTTFAPYHDNTTDRYSGGITFLYIVKKSQNTSLYCYQGNHYYFNDELTIVNTDPYSNVQTKKWVRDDYFNNGVGFGIELTVAKNIGINLMTGYGFYDNFHVINVTGEAALFYKF